MKITNASVKIMRSYDYCHFETCLSMDLDEDDIPIIIELTDALRKDAMRLVDKAVNQYIVAKNDSENRIDTEYEVKRLKARVDNIRKNFPPSEWTPEQKALVKTYGNMVYALGRDKYDYQDNWDENFWDDLNRDEIPF